MRNWDDVLWALSTRADPARDSLIVSDTPVDYLDFASPAPNLGGNSASTPRTSGRARPRATSGAGRSAPTPRWSGVDALWQGCSARALAALTQVSEAKGTATLGWRLDPRPEPSMQLVCPAGALPALTAAIDAGADAVYVGFRDKPMRAPFPASTSTETDLRRGIAYAHARGRRVYIALNTYPEPNRVGYWEAAVDHAAALGADAIIAAELAVLDHAARPTRACRATSVQASATSHAALRYYHEVFGISRGAAAVLALQQVERMAKSPVPLETFAFGSLCIMVEGRCQLSSYVTGASPNRHGVCSPAKLRALGEPPPGAACASTACSSTDSAPANRPATPPCCKGRFSVRARCSTRWRSPPASTRWTCCRLWPPAASRP